MCSVFASLHWLLHSSAISLRATHIYVPLFRTVEPLMLFPPHICSVIFTIKHLVYCFFFNIFNVTWCIKKKFGFHSWQGAGTTQSTCITRRLKNLKMQTKGGLQCGAGEGMKTHHGECWSCLEKLRSILILCFDKGDFCLSSDQAITSGDISPLFTCIRLGTKTEEPFTNASSPHQQRQAKYINEDSEAEDIWQPQLGNYRWGPFECSQPWTPFYHTCQQPAYDSRVCGRTSSLSWATEWDQFEVLIQELERKQSDLTPTPAPTAVTDLPPGPTSVSLSITVNKESSLV